MYDEYLESIRYDKLSISVDGAKTLDQICNKYDVDINRAWRIFEDYEPELKTKGGRYKVNGKASDYFLYKMGAVKL